LGKILGRYILGEVVAAWLLVTGVLLTILLANQIAGVLKRAALGQYPQNVVLELILLGALQNLSILLPIGLLLGIVLAFGRLYHDSEMAAALACGASPVNVFMPIGILALFVTGCLAWLTLDLAPSATMRAYNLSNAALRAGQFAPIAPGKFRIFGADNAVVYAEDASPDGKTLSKVFVERSQGQLAEVAVAEHARHTTSPDGLTHILTLYEGERYEGIPGTPTFRIMHFVEHTVPIQVPAFPDVVHNLDAQPTAKLLGSNDRVARAELEWRVAMPVMCMVLAVLAIPLSRLRPRQGRYDRIWIAVLFYFLYFNLISTGKSWIVHGVLPQTIGLWWVHVVVMGCVLAVIAGPGIGARLRYVVRGR
jgi:lipopolysaccharide export system permease protein